MGGRGTGGGGQGAVERGGVAALLFHAAVATRHEARGCAIASEDRADLRGSRSAGAAGFGGTLSCDEDLRLAEVNDQPMAACVDCLSGNFSVCVFSFCADTLNHSAQQSMRPHSHKLASPALHLRAMDIKKQ